MYRSILLATVATVSVVSISAPASAQNVETVVVTAERLKIGRAHV